MKGNIKIIGNLSLSYKTFIGKEVKEDEIKGQIEVLEKE